jgi:hypothetical protein
MKIITIEQKQSNTGSIHDLASGTRDRDIKIPATAEYVIILAAYYGGKGYSTHATAESAAKKVKSLKKDNYSFEVFDADGSHLDWDGCDFRRGDSNRDLA